MSSFTSEWLAARGQHVVQCLQCGAAFSAPPSKNQKFCSPECAYANSDRTQNIASKQRKDRGNASCRECGKIFKKQTGGGTVFCSQLCASRNTGKRTMSANRAVHPRIKVTKSVCPTCGGVFESWQSHNRIFCSISCAANNVDLKKRRVASFNLGDKIRNYSRCKKGWVELGERRFFAKSRWEANYGHYLEWLRVNNHIKDWKYEAETFWFEGIKRGVMSYLPDFKVTLNDGRVVFHEVKGWMDSKSKTKLKRMKKYHPNVLLLVVDQGWFKRNSRTMSFIPGWK